MIFTSSELFLFEVSCPTWRPCDSCRTGTGKDAEKGKEIRHPGCFHPGSGDYPYAGHSHPVLLALPAIALYEISLHFIELLEKAKGRGR